MARILFIDDDIEMLELYKEALDSYDVEVDILVGGEQAVLKARAFKPHIIFLDYEMPRVKGPHVLKTIKGEEDLKDIPVIMLTGRDDHLEECFTLGAKGFLSKSSTYLHLEILKWVDMLASEGYG